MIPVEPMTNEMLTAIPRTPRAPLVGTDGEPAETISDIFREARAEAEASGRGRLAGPARRDGGGGGGRSGSSSSSSSGPRREGSDGRRSGSGGGGRSGGERAPRPANGEARPAGEAARAAQPGDASRPPRPRRERGPREDRPARRPEAASAQAAPSDAKITARLPVPPAQTVSKESFLKRFTRSVRELVGPSKSN